MKQKKFFIAFQYYIYAGWLAFILLLTTTILSQIKPNFILKIALICFAISIPALGLSVVMTYNRINNSPDLNEKKIKKWHNYHDKLLYITVASSLLGVILVFFNCNIIAALAFVTSLIVSFIIYSKVTEIK